MNLVPQRWKKAISLTLLAFNMSGTRVFAVADAGAKSRVFFGPSLSAKALIKAATNQRWGKKDGCSLGIHKSHKSSQNIEGVRNGQLVCPGVVKTVARLPVLSERARSRLFSWKLPSDMSPVQPPHLHSKK